MNKNLVVDKMEIIKGYLKELYPLLDLPDKEILDDNLKLHSVERLFQLIVDEAIDINTYIISQKKFNVPSDYEGTFSILGQNKVLDITFALKIAPSVGLRNGIVHNYEKISASRMIDLIKNNIADYAEYLRQITAFLEKEQ